MLFDRRCGVWSVVCRGLKSGAKVNAETDEFDSLRRTLKRFNETITSDKNSLSSCLNYSQSQ